MATLKSQVNKLERQRQAAIAAGNTTLAAQLGSQIRALRAQMRTRKEQGAPSAGPYQDYEDRFGRIVQSYIDAIRSGNTQAAYAAVDQKDALLREMMEASKTDQNPTLQTMIMNAHAFLMPKAAAASNAAWWGKPASVLDTPEEKLQGWGLTDQQIAQWTQFNELVQGGMSEEAAAAQVGLELSRLQGWSEVTSWTPEVWQQNYSDVLGGGGGDLPAREGPEQLPGSLYTAAGKIPTYGGMGYGAVPGTSIPWRSLYGMAGGEAAIGRAGSGAYSLAGGWTSGFDQRTWWDQAQYPQPIGAPEPPQRDYLPTSGAPTSGAPTGGTPTSGAPTGGTPTGGTPTGGTPTGGTPTGGTPTEGTPTGAASNTPWLGGAISEAGQEGTQLFGQPWSVTGPVTGAPITVGKKETVIPAGATLIRVRDPMGSDAEQMYYLRYTLNGVDIVYEIGDMRRFHELFPGRAADNFNVEVMNATEFLRHGYFNVGLVDEILGAEESLASMFEREMFAATQGGALAEWVRNDPEALFIFTVGTLEGWDTSRINTALARTTAFHNRFNGYNDFISKHWPKPGDVDVAVALQQYVEWETQIAEYLRYWRGPDTNTRHEYLGKLIGSGWTPGQIAQLLPIEANLKEFPDTLSNLNEILTFMGLNPVGLGDFLRIATGNAPQPVVEALSDFNLYQQLMAEGLTFDVTRVAEMRFGTEGDQIAQRGDFSAMTRSLAQAILSNRAELNVSKYGLNREDLLAAALGRNDFITGGRSPAQVEDLLNKFLRERQAAAGGYEGWSGYISDRDRLQVQGLSGL